MKNIAPVKFLLCLLTFCGFTACGNSSEADKKVIAQTTHEATLSPDGQDISMSLEQDTEIEKTWQHKYYVPGYAAEGVGLEFNLVNSEIGDMKLGIYSHHYARLYELFTGDDGEREVRLKIQYFDLTDWQGAEPYYENELIQVSKAVYSLANNSTGYQLVLEAEDEIELPPWVYLTDHDYSDTVFESCLITNGYEAALSGVEDGTLKVDC